MSQTVEWALHCCWLLGMARAGTPLARRRFAEFFGLPEPYLAKVLRQLVAGRVLASVPGAKGGFRLARRPDEVTVLQIVQATGQESAMFRCSEIRQRGSVGLAPEQCTRPCGIAKVMHRAELAWRDELARTTLADTLAAAPSESQQRAARWLGADARPEIASLVE